MYDSLKEKICLNWDFSIDGTQIIILIKEKSYLSHRTSQEGSSVETAHNAASLICCGHDAIFLKLRHLVIISSLIFLFQVFVILPLCCYAFTLHTNTIRIKHLTHPIVCHWDLFWVECRDDLKFLEIFWVLINLLNNNVTLFQNLVLYAKLVCIIGCLKTNYVIISKIIYILSSL